MCDKILGPDTLNVDMGDFVWNNTAKVVNEEFGMKCNWSVSAAHLYIFGWWWIKFSEVETEELRFGEQCDINLEAKNLEALPHI